MKTIWKKKCASRSNKKQNKIIFLVFCISLFLFCITKQFSPSSSSSCDSKQQKSVFYFLTFSPRAMTALFSHRKTKKQIAAREQHFQQLFLIWKVETEKSFLTKTSQDGVVDHDDDGGDVDADGELCVVGRGVFDGTEVVVFPSLIHIHISGRTLHCGHSQGHCVHLLQEGRGGLFGGRTQVNQPIYDEWSIAPVFPNRSPILLFS